ncbi:MAG: beta-ketoacyl-[acyl-carrier-protein] synthase family protein [Phycisphaerae bacterium]|nr:beta-ketoacyl-[acyl-carrier-protein] synthase family protein [Phycisphaerae bacterium]
MINSEKKHRVVITGMGVVCPTAHDVESFWQGLMSGKSGIAETTIFDASTFPSTFSAEVKDYDYSKYTKNPDIHKDSNRGSGFVIGATVEACKQAGIEVETENPGDSIDRSRLGIYLGAGEGSVDNEVFFDCLAKGWDDENNSMDWQKWAEVAFRDMKPMCELEQEPNMPVCHISLLTGARGPTRSCLTACAASTQAIGEASMMIRSGQADVMIAGGAHSMIHPLGQMGFNRLTALSTRNDDPQTASRPFSATRDGFVLGEGAAVLILESLESAKKRGAKVLAEIVGYGSTADAFRVTDMHEDARGAQAAIRAALADAGVGCEDIDYISTHGTSTAENDSIETKAVKGVFGDYAKNVPLSSIKSMMGHLIGATGAAETISCVMAFRENTIPPTMNLHDADPELDLDYVPNEPRKAELNYIIKESFGFGGQNNVLVLKRYEDD